MYPDSKASYKGVTPDSFKLNARDINYRKRYFMSRDGIKLALMTASIIVGDVLNLDSEDFEIELIDDVKKEWVSSHIKQVKSSSWGTKTSPKIIINLAKISDFSKEFEDKEENKKYAQYLELWKIICMELRYSYQYIIMDTYAINVSFGTKKELQLESKETCLKWIGALEHYKKNNINLDLGDENINFLDYDSSVFAYYILDALGLIEVKYPYELKKVKEFVSSFRRRYNKKLKKSLQSLKYTPQEIFENDGKLSGFRFRS